MLGTDAEQVLTKAYMTLGHDPSVERVAFPEDGSAIVGMPSAYTSHQYSESSEGPLIRAAGRRAARMAIVSFAASRLFRFIETVADGDSPLGQPFVRRVVEAYHCVERAGMGGMMRVPDCAALGGSIWPRDCAGSPQGSTAGRRRDSYDSLSSMRRIRSQFPSSRAPDAATAGFAPYADVCEVWWSA
jgi:hypothetical protein